jgi:hypothetical protein
LGFNHPFGGAGVRSHPHHGNYTKNMAIILKIMANLAKFLEQIGTVFGGTYGI